MPTVHLIHGHLGSGKTTLAKKLAEDFNGVRFNLNGCLYIADNTFEVLKTRFEPLAADERHLLIDAEEGLPMSSSNSHTGS